MKTKKKYSHDTLHVSNSKNLDCDKKGPLALPVFSEMTDMKINLAIDNSDVLHCTGR